jgi:hypothetical protein
MRRIGVVLKVLGAGLLVAALTGAIYEQVGQRKDRQRLPRIGRSVDIGGRSLNIFCAGEGSRRSWEVRFRFADRLALGSADDQL